jgi:hypothetical protein
MKKLLLLSFFVFALSATFVVSCSKDTTSNTDGTSVADTKAFISSTSENSLTCIRGIRDGDAAQALIKFLALSNGNVGNENWIDDMKNALEIAMGKQIAIDDANSKFDFAAYRGVFTWNGGSGTFSKTSSPGIYVNFPSEPAQTNNNVNIKFTNYLDGLYQANSKNIYLPTAVNASVLKDNTEIANVAYTGTFSTGDFPSPVNVVCTVFLKPHNYKVSVSRINSTKFSVHAELGGDCSSVVDATVSFNNGDYNNFDIEDDLDKVEVTYAKGDFSIKGTWDAKTYYLLTSPTTPDLNNSFHFTINRSGNKIGDLQFKDVGGDKNLFIYYKDGTSENTSVYYDPFLDSFKSILRPYFGNDVDDWF